MIISLRATTLTRRWEQRFDAGTRRPYYVDHNTRTTHWTAPVVCWPIDRAFKIQDDLTFEISAAQNSAKRPQFPTHLHADAGWGASGKGRPRITANGRGAAHPPDHPRPAVRVCMGTFSDEFNNFIISHLVCFYIYGAC
jgi:hypothetical protein